MPKTVTLSARIADDTVQCPKCGQNTLRRVDVMMAPDIVLASHGLCETCQIPHPWGQPPAIWTEPTDTVPPLDVVAHG